MAVVFGRVEKPTIFPFSHNVFKNILSRSREKVGNAMKRIKKSEACLIVLDCIDGRRGKNRSTLKGALEDYLNVSLV